MFLIRLWHYLKGYVIIIVSGKSVERFINICTRREILLWDMERVGHDTVRMKISINGFKKARTAARKSRCHVHITGKKGLPYVMGAYKKRKGFLAGIFAFALLIYLMTSIIWSIEISGNHLVQTNEMIEQMNEMGIYRGVSKRFIDPKLLADTLMLKNSRLSWVGVEIKGIRLNILVKEGVEPPQVVPVDKPCHIVSEKDGIILSIQAKNGLVMVKEGDTVVKGQIVISGNIESIHPEFGEKQVHAIGEVIARTWYEVEKDVPVKQIVRRRTGRVWNKTSVYFLDFRIPLPSGELPFQVYETGIFDKAPVFGKKFRLPFGITTQRFYELEEEERVPLQEEARKLAQEAAEKELKKLIPEDAEITDRQMKITTKNEKEYLAITVECKENIASEQEIGGD